MKRCMMQQTIFREPDAEIETVNGVKKWEDYLHELVRDMKKHGRQAQIKQEKGQLALYVNRMASHDKRVMQNCYMVNVRTMGD